jgi:hypothetical protein
VFEACFGYIRSSPDSLAHPPRLASPIPGGYSIVKPTLSDSARVYFWTLNTLVKATFSVSVSVGLVPRPSALATLKPILAPNRPEPSESEAQGRSVSPAPTGRNLSAEVLV